jgi:hypothetical protein
MNVGKALYNILSNDAEIVAICGTRVYPEIADQDASLPFIVYKVSDIQPSGTKSGSSSLDTARVDVYCVSEEYGEAMTISDEVRSALDRVGGTYTGVNIQSIDFDTADVEYDSDQRAYIAEATYNVRVLRVGQAPDINIQPLSILTVEEVDGDPSGLVNKLVVSNGALSIDGSTATITTGGGAFTDLSDTPGTLGTAGQVVAVNTGGTALEFVNQSGAAVQYHGRYDTEAETKRSGATATLEVYYTARPDGDGFAESEVSDTGVTDTINRTLFYSTKYLADPDTAGDWTQYTTQPADNATFATAKAALLAGLNDTDATAETRGTLPLSLKMVRTTTPVVSGDLLLDTYTGSAAAYSVRKLRAAHSGACMRIRRASDDAETDIGFDTNGDLDTAAIASHCGASAGYCVTWVDQSGNGNNATQSTASEQPQIYNGTAVITENGKPALLLDGSNDYLDKSTTDSVSGFVSLFTVGTSDSLSAGGAQGSGRCLASLGTTTTNGQRRANIIWNGGSGTWRYYTSVYGANNPIATATVDAQYLHSSIFDAAGNVNKGAIDGGTLLNLNGTINAMTNYTIRIGTSSANEYWSGYIQEIVAYKVDQGTNRTGIESDINTYFSIY